MNSESHLTSGQDKHRAPVKKAEGVTVAEKYLARLCERSFLSLWSYPNVYRDEGKHGDDGHGKEICDLLVIFDRHVIIFSDKYCAIQDSGDATRDWQRWFRKAIQNSAEQAWGAERWIRQNPNRIFLDRECKRPLPIELPQVNQATFHLILVAHGVSSRIKRDFGSDSGSLMLNSNLQGFDQHICPFYLGDIAPQKTFIHVLDDDSLLTLMTARDTISDFVAYLAKREKLLRGHPTILATGEEQLLGVYLKNLNDKNEHDFVFPIKSGQDVTSVFLPEGHWEDFQNSPQRVTQIRQDRVSFAWDKLIEKFNHYAMRGEQHFVTGGGIKDAERILRFMAREPRWKRRYLAQLLLKMIDTTPATKRRLTVIPSIEVGDPYYVFLLLPRGPAKSAEDYRIVRREYLVECCRIAKLEYSDAVDIVGIATESGADIQCRTEDAIHFDARDWNANMASDAKIVQEKLGILMKPRR